MSLLRRLPTSRLIVLIAAAAVALGAGTALAAGVLSSNGPKPPAKPLAQALHDAATAPQPQGITARITFTNKLIDSSSLGAAGPLLSGATGRLWASADGRLRLELQSDRGDAQIVSDGKVVTIYDASSNSAYRITLPAQQDAPAKDSSDTPPTVARIEKFLSSLAGTVDVSGATPDNVAGREAYSVKLAPAHDGGLLGDVQLAWDAANGIPLRAAVYAAGSDTPVLELTATSIDTGPVADADLTASPPADAKIVTVDLPASPGKQDDKAHEPAATTGPASVANELPFKLSAPDSLVGLPRKGVRLVTLDGKQGALVTYGAGLGGVAVLEQQAPPAAAATTPPKDGGRDGALALPKVSIDGTDGTELATALGTLVRFERGGVQYTILGSVPPAAAEAAARGL